TFKKGFKGEAKELTLADNVKVKNATGKKEDKFEVTVGEDLKNGLKNERFTKNRFLPAPGVFSQIITNDDGKVTEIRVFPKVKGSANPRYAGGVLSGPRKTISNYRSAPRLPPPSPPCPPPAARTPTVATHDAEEPGLYPSGSIGTGDDARRPS